MCMIFFRKMVADLPDNVTVVNTATTSMQVLFRTNIMNYSLRFSPIESPIPVASQTGMLFIVELRS